MRQLRNFLRIINLLLQARGVAPARPAMPGEKEGAPLQRAHDAFAQFACSPVALFSQACARPLCPFSVGPCRCDPGVGMGRRCALGLAGAYMPHAPRCACCLARGRSGCSALLPGDHVAHIFF